MAALRFSLRFLAFTALLATVFAPARAERPERVKVWVSLADKGPAGVEPAASASSAQRLAYENAPVHEPHLQALRNAGLEVVVALKWQNAVSGWVDARSLGAVSRLSFVRRVDELPRKAPSVSDVAVAPTAAASAKASAASQDFGAFATLFDAVGATAVRDTVAQRNLKPGAGIKIAVMDADFRLGHSAFDSLFARGAIIDQYDFVANNPVAVTRTFGNSHGAQVLSQIAGELPGILQGLAPHARFLLYRTESEPIEAYVEEDYLAAAIERAVDSGAHVLSISLGYRYDFDTDPEIPYAQMDGRTRPSSIAAVAAARRGVLVVVAIGNEYESRGGQPTVTAPSDADSILAVGAASAAGARCNYSSTGPTADGRRKPEVSSLGCSMPLANTSTATGVFNQSGTSFAAPVVAGVAVLLRQLHPDSTGGSAQRIREALIKTASRDSVADNLVGHGIIRAAHAHCRLLGDAPCTVPAGIKNLYVWRGGAIAEFPWATKLDPSKARAWDFQGRSVKLQGRWNAEGEVELSTGRRRAPSPLILKIPVE